MTKKLSFLVIFSSLLITVLQTHAQLTINNATFVIESGAVVTVQGNLSSDISIGGAGKIVMKGSGTQTMDMNGFTIPSLEIDNTANVTLTGNVTVGSSLLFTNGKIQLGDNDLTLASATTIAGQGLASGNFIETNGTGQLFKQLTANVTNAELPLGSGTTYRPGFITASGTYSNAKVGVKVQAATAPDKPASTSDYLLTNWPVTKTGITGTLTVSGQYNASDISGTENNLRGYYYNGSDWSSVGEAHDINLNRVSAPITAASGDVSGMDKFVFVRAKAFLQGAYNAATGLMSDGLRTPANVIPLSDPYRTAPYNTSFIHVANPVTETASASVFTTQALANDNIVDWVFLELRTNGTNPGNVVAQTRSALIQRDGDIVDVDGVSPVTFNNVANGSYTVAVRHRNHLGISADPVVNQLAVSEQRSTAPLLDLTTATDAQVYGTATAYAVTGGKNLMWSGNINSNTQIKYTGPANDKDYLLATILGGVATNVVNGYTAGDLNFNGNAKYTGPANDKDFLLATSLAGVATNVRTQALPQ